MKYPLCRRRSLRRDHHHRYRWSDETRTITSESRTSSGLTFTGTVEPLGDAPRYLTTVHGELPDGTEMKMRDTSDLSSAEASVTTAERWDGGAWVPLDGATWRRVTASAWCAAGPN